MMKHILSMIAIVSAFLCCSISMQAKNQVQTPNFDFPKKTSEKAAADLNKALKTNDASLLIDALVRYGIA